MKRSVLWALDRAADLFGASPVTPDGTVTYGQVAERVRDLRGGLAALGVTVGDAVGVLMGNSLRHLELSYAIPGSGAVLADLDVRRSLDDVERMVNDSAMSVLFVDDEHLDVATRLEERCGRLRQLVHWAATAGGPRTLDGDLIGGAAASPVVDEEWPAAICYADPDRPRGVTLSHANLLHQALQLQSYVGVRSDDRYLHALAMSHPSDLALSCLTTWAGARHSFAAGLSARAVRETVEAERVTITLLEPATTAMLLDDPQTYGADLSSLRAVIDNSAVTVNLHCRLADLLAADVHRFYGRPEAGPIIIDLTTGRPPPGLSLQLRRADGRTSVGQGEPGEIFVRGPNVMLGYWNRPDETAGVVDDTGWYRTGDLAVADDNGRIQPLPGATEVLLPGDMHDAPIGGHAVAGSPPAGGSFAMRNNADRPGRAGDQ